MPDNNMERLPDIYEDFFGKITEGWSDPNSLSSTQVVCFENTPYNNIKTLITLGLSENCFRSEVGTIIRQELMISIDSSTSFGTLPDLMISLSDNIVENRAPLARGSHINLRYPIAVDSALTGIYVGNPSSIDGLIETLSHIDPTFVIAYLTPISEKELDFLHNFGWLAFEKHFEEVDPNIWNLQRASSIP